MSLLEKKNLYAYYFTMAFCDEIATSDWNQKIHMMSSRTNFPFEDHWAKERCSKWIPNYCTDTIHTFFRRNTIQFTCLDRLFCCFSDFCFNWKFWLVAVRGCCDKYLDLCMLSLSVYGDFCFLILFLFCKIFILNYLNCLICFCCWCCVMCNQMMMMMTMC